MTTTTLRKELNAARFDWETGRVAYQQVENDDPIWGKPIAPTELISFHHPILDQEFNPGFGGCQMPRFIAEDSEWIYFPHGYDGSTTVVAIRKDGIAGYLGTMEPTPYIGE